MLPNKLLRLMDDETLTDWNAMATQLRPFVRKRVANHADADDVVQNVLLNMHRNLKSLSDKERISAWMYRIARRSIADYWRDRARNPLAEQGTAVIEQSTKLDLLSDGHAAKEMASYLSFFVVMLPAPYRQAITLTELEGRTQKQAAEMLEISLPALKSRVHRGREKLRALMERCCEIALDSRGKVVGYTPRQMSKCDC